MSQRVRPCAKIKLAFVFPEVQKNQGNKRNGSSFVANIWIRLQTDPNKHALSTRSVK